MTANIFAIALMPISQAVSWYFVLKRPLYASVLKIASFYCAWALYIRIFVTSKEMNQFPLGFLAVGAYLERKNLAVAGTIIELVIYVVVFFLVFSLSASELALKHKKEDTPLAICWAYVFKLYSLSNICLWCLVLHKLRKDGKVGKVRKPDKPVLSV
jgi:hypothetical protein